MGKFRRFCVLLLLLFLLPGKVFASAEDHIVTGIRVSYRQEKEQLHRQYTKPGEMEAVLNFLRLAKFAGLPDDDPQQHIGSRCTVTVDLAGGGSRVYYLLGERYLSKDGRPWEMVKFPEPLPALLLALPGDETGRAA